MSRKRDDGVRLADVRQVTHGFDNHEHPVFSPDGRQIAYYAGRFGAINLFVVDQDGHGSRPLTAARGNHTQPDWTPDGKWIFFRAQATPKTPWSIQRLSVEDPAVREVVLADRKAHFKHPSVSPDGDALVWFSDLGSAGRFHLWKGALAGGAVRKPGKLTDDRDRNDCHPTWSPCGRFIVFHAYTGVEDASTSHIYAVTADGSGLRRLTDTEAFHKHPFFVGRDLVVHHTEEASGSRYLALRRFADGALVARLTSGKKNDKHPSPFVPPRGPTRICFSSKKRGETLDAEGDDTFDVFWGNLEGVRVRR